MIDTIVLNFDDVEIDAGELGELLTRLSKMYSVIHYAMGSDAPLELKGNIPQYCIESTTTDVVRRVQNIIIQSVEKLDHRLEARIDRIGELIGILSPNKAPK